MSSSYENTVFDFDLDFLNHPSTINAEPDLQAKANRLRKSIIYLKQRITCIDKLTVACKTAKKEKEDLGNSHMQLKQQCGQHLMEISFFIGKVTRLENEIQAVETREREKIETICELENKVLALETVINQLKILDKEKNKTESTPVKVEIKKGKAGIANNAKKGVETLRKDNANILNLEKENEKLRKENARIPNLEKEIENLRKKSILLSKSDSVSHNEIARIQKLEKQIENLYKENAKIPKLEKEIENLQKENVKIPNLMEQIENLKKENAIIPKLMKEIENLQKDNSKIPKLVKEIESLRKENAKITKFGIENETVFKQNVKISNLEKDIETLRIKNAKLEIDKALSKEIVKIPNKGEDIETRLTDRTSTTKEKGKLRPKLNNLTRKYKSLPDRKGEWSDNSEAENNLFEDPLLSPTRHDTIDAKKCPIAEKDIAVTRESDNDNSNEVASVDTGRGSSLANSDTDKGQHSPEYFLNYSPSNGENIENRAKTKDATMIRRPILLEEFETPTITIVKHTENQNVCEAKSASHRKSHPKLMSTVNQTDAAREVSNSVDTFDNVSPKKRIQSVQEKECLEMNNRLQCESHTELELENIFSTMKLNYNAVSPIPRTPILVHEVDSTSSSSVLDEKFKRCSVLCYKTVDFMRILMGLVLSQRRDDNSFIINECDRLISSFETILKSEQILSKNSTHITNSNMEISDCVLSHDNNNLGSISNPESTTSSSEKETEICQNTKGENRLSQNVCFMLQNGNLNQSLRDDNNAVVTISNPLRKKQVVNQKQLFNHSVSEELVINSEISKVTDSVRCSRDFVEINQPPINNSVGKKAKHRKITKLEKLKKKLIPKYKIIMEKPENLRIKPKRKFPIKKKESVNDTSASLNDKDAYEKAVKFMAEMKSQQAVKAKSPKHTTVLMSPSRTACLGKDSNSSSDNQVLQDCAITTRSKRKFSEPFDTCAVVLVKDPLLLSPRKAENSTTHEAEEDNNSTTHRAKEDNNSTTNTAKEDNNSITHRAKEDNNSSTHGAKDDISSTTHRAKEDNNSTTHRAKEDSNSSTHRTKEDNNAMTPRAKEDNNSTSHRVKEDNNATSHRSKEDNSSTTLGAKEDKNCTTHIAKEDNNSMTHEEEEDNESSDELSSRKRRRRSANEPLIQYKRVLRSATIHSRLSTEDNIELSKSKAESNMKSIMDPSTNESGTQFNNEDTLQCLQLDRHDNNVVSYGDFDVFSEDIQLEKKMSPPVVIKEDNNFTTLISKKDNNSMTHKGEGNNESFDEPLRKRRRPSSNQPLIQYKRVLRSAPIHTRLITEDNIELSESQDESNRKSVMDQSVNESGMQLNNENTLQCLQLERNDDNVISYGDLDVFAEDTQLDKKISGSLREVNTDASACNPEESILCYMIEKDAREAVRPYGKKIPDNKLNQICEKIEQHITTIAETNDRKNAMNNFVADLRKLNYKLFIEGLIKYLAKPERKFELLGKVTLFSKFSAMTKAEQILLYAITELETLWPSVVDGVLGSIEFTLFKLNRTPEFDVVESTSHFYALLCKNYKAKNRLRLFMLDAMYCIQFKSVPLIKQCLEVWKELIPFPHKRIAKSPMVTCLVYLLHFYKCDDKLNRVQEIRNILRQRYNYQITNWNETKILEMFKNYIKYLKDISIEKKMLRLALIILAKRNGPKWCQNHIIKNLLQPMIEKENVPNYVKEFCVSMVGPLMKPYPVDMKVHCEIAIIQLVDILNNNPSPEMEEAAITSMMYINRHDQRSINKTLLSRKMKPMSLALEKSICDYVKAKPLKIWKTILLNREYACKRQ